MERFALFVVVCSVILANLALEGSAHPMMDSSTRERYLTERLLANIQSLEAALLRQQQNRDLRSEEVSVGVSQPVESIVGSGSGHEGINAADRIRSLRQQRRNFRKRNYNLDHLARMNFRRSFRASSALNNRHILGGLKK